ncbi:unnamed protein product [Sphenostylis stenocarpa]|uniref:Uncharacterized protein n=1 Tax=Sphenostylis stenocarpa TaxID=92480 RepID=A0AA86T279_9FABA|nr:unnamed protein product [Sphenostylis stenocarpa]
MLTESENNFTLTGTAPSKGHPLTTHRLPFLLTSSTSRTCSSPSLPISSHSPQINISQITTPLHHGSLHRPQSPNLHSPFIPFSSPSLIFSQQHPLHLLNHLRQSPPRAALTGAANPAQAAAYRLLTCTNPSIWFPISVVPPLCSHLLSSRPNHRATRGPPSPVSRRHCDSQHHQSRPTFTRTLAAYFRPSRRNQEPPVA